MDNKLSFYRLINKLKWPKGYTGKIFLIAFIGTHIPLIGLFVFLTFYFPIDERAVILIALLIATVVGASVTLYFIFRLLAPILLTNKAVIKYYSEKELPNLPTGFTDEAGLLMANTQECIKELDELLVLKNRLIGMVSHDSKTPIGSIKIANGLIREEIESGSLNEEDILKYIELIETSANTHAEFLDNMLTLARFDDGKIHINKTDIQVEDIFEKLKKNHRVYFKLKNIDFITKSELEKGETINADQEKLISILNNLIQNAIKFSKDNADIELTISKDSKNHIIQVKDHGIGIPKEHKKTIFEAFSDSSNGTKSEVGSGLGLWIVKVFTNLHNGTVFFESEEGKGTSFTVSLPIG